MKKNGATTAGAGDTRSQGLRVIKSLLCTLESLVRKSEHKGEDILVLRGFLEQLIEHMKNFVRRVVALSNLYCVMLKKINYVGKELKGLNDQLSLQYVQWKAKSEPKLSELEHLERAVKQGAEVKMDHLRQQLRKLQAIQILINVDRLDDHLARATDVEIDGKDLLEINPSNSVSIRDQSRLEREFQETLRVVMDLGRESLRELPLPRQPTPSKSTVKLKLTRGGPLTDPTLRQGTTGRRVQAVPRSGGLLKADEFSIPSSVLTPDCPSEPSCFSSEGLIEQALPPLPRFQPMLDRSVGESVQTQVTQKSYRSQGVGSILIENQFSIVQALEESVACAMSLEKPSLCDKSVSIQEFSIKMEQNEISVKANSLRQKSIQFSALVEQKSLMDQSLQYDEPVYEPEVRSVGNSAIEAQHSLIDQSQQFSSPQKSCYDQSAQCSREVGVDRGVNPILAQQRSMGVQEDWQPVQPEQYSVSIQAASLDGDKFLDNQRRLDFLQQWEVENCEASLQVDPHSLMSEPESKHLVGRHVQVSVSKEEGVDRSVGGYTSYFATANSVKSYPAMVNQSIGNQSLESKITAVSSTEKATQSWVAVKQSGVQCDLIDWAALYRPLPPTCSEKALSVQSGYSASVVDRSLSAYGGVPVRAEEAGIQAGTLMRDQVLSARTMSSAKRSVASVRSQAISGGPALSFKSQALSAADFQQKPQLHSRGLSASKFKPSPEMQSRGLSARTEVDVQSVALSGRGVPSVRSEAIEADMSPPPRAVDRTAVFGRGALVTGSDENPLLSQFEAPQSQGKPTPYIKKTKASMVYSPEEKVFDSQQLQYDKQKYAMKGRKMLQTGRNSESLVIATPRDADNQGLRVYQPCLIQPEEEQRAFIVYDLKKRLIKRFKGRTYFYKHFGVAQMKTAALVAGGIDSQNLVTVAQTHWLSISGDVKACAEMGVARADLAMAAGGAEKEIVYATGGWSNQMLCNVEVYSCATDIWGPLPALLEPRAAHAACVYSENGRKEWLYVFCGVSRDKNLSSIERLGLERGNSWREVKVDCDLNFWQPRSHLQAVQVNDKEMVVFGSHQISKVTFVVQPLGSGVVVSSATQDEQRVPTTSYRRVTTVLRNRLAVVTENYELWFFSKGHWKPCLV